MIDFKKSEKEIASDFMRIVNNFSFNPKQLAEELGNSKEMKKLAYHWLVVLSSNSYMTDGRNEIAAKKGKELAEIPFIKSKLENLKDDMKMIKIALEISREHRTLQQTFSGFVFYYIFISSTAKQQAEITNRLGETFYRLPLI